MRVKKCTGIGTNVQKIKDDKLLQHFLIVNRFGCFVSLFCTNHFAVLFSSFVENCLHAKRVTTEG